MKKIVLTLALIAAALLATACEGPKTPAPFTTVTSEGEEVLCEYDREDREWECEEMAS